MKKLIVLFSCIFFSLHASCFYKSVRVTNLDGLPSNVVCTMMQDSRGILWVGTWNGLCEYDSRGFYCYQNLSYKENSLIGNSVEVIVEQRPGIVWVVTEAALNRIDWRTKEMRSYLLSSRLGRSENFGYYVAASPAGHVFCSVVGTGLFYYDEQKDSMMPFNVSGVSTADVRKIVCGSDESLLLEMLDGSAYHVRYSFDESGLVLTSPCKRLFGGGEVRYLEKTRDGVFFILHGSVCRLEEDGGTGVQEYPCIVPSGKVSDVEMYEDGQLLVLLDRQKVFRVNPDEGKVLYDEFLSKYNTVFLYYASQGVLWLGMDNRGLLKVYEDNMAVSKYTNDAFTQDDVSVVYSFVEDDCGNIFAATQGSGIYTVLGDGRTRSFTTRNSSLSSDEICCMVKDSCGRVYIGGLGGVDVAICRGGQLSGIRHLQSPPGYVYSMCLGDGGRELWIGTLKDGLWGIYFSEDGSVSRTVHYLEEPTGNFENLNNFVVCVVEDVRDRDYVWAAKNPDRLMHVRKSDGHVEYADISGDFGKMILSMAYDSQGTLWLGGEGLARQDSDGSFSLFARMEGNNGYIHAIEEDSEGRLWVSMNKGLAFTDKVSPVLNEIGDFEVFKNLEFCNHSSFKDSRGRLYFGGIDGYNVIDPEGVHLSDFSPSMVLRDFSVKGKARELPSPDNIVNLAWNDNFFAISYCALDFIRPARCRYQYRLKGFIDEWTDSGALRTAVFTNVPPGNYEFQVKSTNGDGVPCDNMLSLRIRIAHPWYKTLVAYVAYALIFVFTVFSVYHVALKIRRRKRAASEESAEKEREKKIFASKLDFFTDIAKNLGSPITLISGWAYQLSSQFNLPPKAGEYIESIRSNAEKMNTLINEVSEFRDVGSGHYVPKYNVVKPGPLVRMIMNNVLISKGKSMSAVTLSIVRDVDRFVTDDSAFEKIFTSVMSHALETASGDRPISVSLSAGEDSLRLAIEYLSDRKEDVSLLFDSYSTMEKNGNGMAGISLALVRNYVEALDGTIKAESSGENSQSFIMELPCADLSLAPSSSMISDDRNTAIHAALAVDARKLTVLVVDSEKEIRTLIKDSIAGDYSIVEASDVGETMEIMGNIRPDLIITEFRLRGHEGGGDLINRLKSNEITRHIPVVLLAYMSECNEIGNLAYTVESFITMPFRPDYLGGTVENILRSRRDLKSFYNSAASNLEMFADKKMNSKDKEYSIAVLKLIEENISNVDLSPAMLAEAMCTSSMSQYRRVREIFSTTPVDLIRRVKLAHAEKLLRTTTLTVGEVMYNSGFNSRSYFIRKFIETYGLSPKQYRDKNAK